MNAMREKHKERILRYCEKHGSITVREAFGLDINSPTKRISEMRHSPQYIVDTIEDRRTNSDGIEVRFVRYFIKKRRDGENDGS